MKELVKFDDTKHFQRPSPYQSVKGDAVYLLEGGMKLVAEYYQDKYQLENVIFVTKGSSKNEEFINLIASENFKAMKGDTEDVRLPFILGDEEGGHSTPIVYIKEGKEEALLLFDTGSMMQDEKANLMSGIDLPIYTLTEPRQADNLSCHTDALVFIRELAGRSDDGEFLIPHILETLGEKAELETKLKVELETESGTELKPVSNVWNVKLPDRLLKTAQRPKFVAMHKQGDQIIHMHGSEPETYDNFIKRYPTEDVSDKGTPYTSGYLVEKGLKYAHIIEIQFYLNQLKEILGENYTDEIRTKFIMDAKMKFQLYEKSSFENEPMRNGLFDLAQNYMDKYLEKKHNSEPS